jgi:hypothetical protein
MPKRRLVVNVDTWGSNPAFTRGQVIEVDTDDKDNPFPHDIDWAVGNGTVLDLDEQEALREAQEGRVAQPGADVVRAARLPSGDSTVLNAVETGVSRHEYLTAEQQQASVAGDAVGAGLVTDQDEPPAPDDPADPAAPAGPVVPAPAGPDLADGPAPAGRKR